MKRVSLESSVAWEMDEPLPEGFKPDTDEKFAPGIEFVSTEDVVNYLNSAKNTISAIDQDVINNSAILETLLVNQWVSFVQTFQKFYDDNIDSSHILNAASVMGEVDNYLARATSYQKTAIKQGGSKYTGTAPVRDITEPETMQTMVKTIGIAAGIILGGLAVLKGLDYVPKPAKQLRRKSEVEDESE
jgi:hypothetical protein